MPTTARVFLSTVLLLVAIVALGSVVVRAGGPQLLSEHSRPAVTLPSQQVAIVQGGKTFHDPKCTFMHGKPEMVSAEEAVQKGYAPCVRCMRQALKK
jgi:hypothetical protein